LRAASQFSFSLSAFGAFAWASINAVDSETLVFSLPRSTKPFWRKNFWKKSADEQILNRQSKTRLSIKVIRWRDDGHRFGAHVLNYNFSTVSCTHNFINIGILTSIIEIQKSKLWKTGKRKGEKLRIQTEVDKRYQ